MRLIIEITYLFFFCKFSLIKCVLIPVEVSETFTFCQDLTCLENFVLHKYQDGEVVICFASFDVSYDTNLTYYLGWVRYLFENSIIKFHILLVDCLDKDERFNPFATWLVKNLPDNTIFTTNGIFGQSALEFFLLGNMRLEAGFTNSGIFRLNDEFPWKVTTHNTANISLPDNKPHNIYNLFKVSLRNYFYKPIHESTIYVPLGPMYYKWYIGGNNDKYSFLRKSSERKYKCTFSGRLFYPEYSPHQLEREVLFNLSSEGKFTCHLLGDTMSWSLMHVL